MSIVAVCSLESISPLSFSRHYRVEKLQKESPSDYETRTWPERMHVDDNGIVYIPPMAFKLCITAAASFLSMKIPGKRNATFTKHFTAGILVLEALSLGIHKKDVKGEWLFVPSDGKRGGSSRVDKCFPLIPQWSGDVTFHVLDRTITEEVFEEHIREAGNFIGLGRFRPANNGFYGRFKVNKFAWKES
jgi:hypothetical protein